jgi:hypothetical protein
MNKLLLPYLLAPFWGLQTYAQPKSVIPLSPEAAALSKAINYPVGHDTGIPNISVPIHEVAVGRLKIPIALSYHAGGFKIGELPANVGMGWSPSTDLQITRKIDGKHNFYQRWCIQIINLFFTTITQKICFSNLASLARQHFFSYYKLTDLSEKTDKERRPKYHHKTAIESYTFDG